MWSVVDGRWSSIVRRSSSIEQISRHDNVGQSAAVPSESDVLPLDTARSERCCLNRCVQLLRPDETRRVTSSIIARHRISTRSLRDDPASKRTRDRQNERIMAVSARAAYSAHPCSSSIVVHRLQRAHCEMTRRVISTSAMLALRAMHFGGRCQRISGADCTDWGSVLSSAAARKDAKGLSIGGGCQRIVVGLVSRVSCRQSSVVGRRWLAGPARTRCCLRVTTYFSEQRRPMEIDAVLRVAGGGYVEVKAKRASERKRRP